jgi:phenylacetate-CoA ligase
MFQNAYGYGLFTGGLGLHYGAELLGMTVIPISGGNTERQIMALQDFGVRVIACTPSYALTLAEALAAREIRPGSLALRCGVLGAEPWTEGMRRQIEAQMGIAAVNIYGLSEVMGPGVSNECVQAKQGSHIFEDHFLAEVVDPQTGEPLPASQVGELVLTTLTKEAIPVIRYRTGDLTALDPEQCRCGRTLVRMGPVVGRTDDMLIIRGVNVYPSQVEQALLAIPDLSPHYQIVVTRERTLDDLEIKVEVTDGFAIDLGGVSETHPRMVALAERCGQALRSALGVKSKVTLAAPGSLPRSEGGKLRRVRDERKLS